jgi:hypothetical protein
MATKVVKWKKVPGWVDWKTIQKKLTRDAKKRKFTSRLKNGNNTRTSDPGPH